MLVRADSVADCRRAVHQEIARQLDVQWKQYINVCIKSADYYTVRGPSISLKVEWIERGLRGDGKWLQRDFRFPKEDPLYEERGYDYPIHQDMWEKQSDVKLYTGILESDPDTGEFIFPYSVQLSIQLQQLQDTISALREGLKECAKTPEGFTRLLEGLAPLAKLLTDKGT